MGTISDKLTYLNTTKGKIKDSINLTGAGITDQDTFRSYETKLKDGFVDIINNGVDTLYENFPKVAQTGEEPTLNGVYEAPMRVDLNGNTEQNSYSGKNYAIITPKDISQYGLTITYDTNTGKISIKGKANTTAGIGVANSSDLNIPSGDYTLSINKALPCLINYVVTDTQNTNRAFRIPAGSTNVTVNIPYDGISSGLFVAIENNVDYDLEFYLQLESGSTPTSYEPYVGGTPSPNPDYPQPIRVVKGDNTIKVIGKNILSSEIEQGEYNPSNGNKRNASGSYRNINPIPVKPNTNYIFSINGTGYAVNVYEYDKDNNFIGILGNAPVSANNSFTTSTSTRYINIFRGSSAGNEKWQIEYGNQPTTYEPYQETTYPIDLIGKNLLAYTLASLKTLNILGTWNDNVYTMSNVTYTINDDLTIKVNGTADSTSYLIINDNINLDSGINYLLNGSPSDGAYNTYAIRLYDGSSYSSQTGSDLSFTYGTQSLVRINVFNGTSLNNLVFKPMIRLASITDDTYEPYYNYELCEINKIRKSTGKNLIDISENLNTSNRGINYTYNNNTSLTLNGTATDTYSYVVGTTTLNTPLEAGVYTFSINHSIPLELRFYVTFEDNTTERYSIQQGNTSITFTTAKKIAKYYFSLNNLTTNTQYNETIFVQIEKNNQATDYEPYGKVWYLKKNIGKVVLDGSEADWLLSPAGGLNRYLYQLQNPVLSTSCISSHFKGVPYGTHQDYGCYVGTTGKLALYYNSITTLEGFKTWLSNNPVTVYYVLATPTIEILPETALITELETLKTAKSVEGQTNITQTNEELPFILDVSGLKKD